MKKTACAVLVIIMIFANAAYSNAAAKPHKAGTEGKATQAEKQLKANQLRLLEDASEKQFDFAKAKTKKTKTSKKAKTRIYWGGYGNGDGDFKIKYKGHKLYMVGVAYKLKPGQEVSYGVDKKRKVRKTVKISDNCKISIGSESVTDFKFKNKKKLKYYWGREGTWLKAPSIYVKVKGNKAVLISYGA